MLDEEGEIGVRFGDGVTDMTATTADVHKSCGPEARLVGCAKDTSAAKALQRQGVEMVRANMDGEGSLAGAFEVD